MYAYITEACNLCKTFFFLFLKCNSILEYYMIFWHEVLKFWLGGQTTRISFFPCASVEINILFKCFKIVCNATHGKWPCSKKKNDETQHSNISTAGVCRVKTYNRRAVSRRTWIIIGYHNSVFQVPETFGKFVINGQTHTTDHRVVSVSIWERF